MSNSIKDSIGGTLQDIVNLGIETPFTERELRELGVVLPEIHISASDIKNIRKKLNVSQAVFARILNVSLSSVPRFLCKWQYEIPCIAATTDSPDRQLSEVRFFMIH